VDWSCSLISCIHDLVFFLALWAVGEVRKRSRVLSVKEYQRTVMVLKGRSRSATSCAMPAQPAGRCALASRAALPVKVGTDQSEETSILDIGTSFIVCARKT
jgi:hypothetical protein